MKTLHFKILTQFKTPQPLHGASGLVAYFQGDNDVMEKTGVEVVDPNEGTCKIELSDFDVQGLQLGKGHNFTVCFHDQDGRKHTALFQKCFDVVLNSGRKSII